MKSNLLKNPLALVAVVLSVAAAAVYLFAPLFTVPLFGFRDGWDYVMIMHAQKQYANIAALLLPVIGAVGMTACLWARSFGPHILAMAFAALPVMFWTYFLYILGSSYPDIILSATETAPMLSVVGWGSWLSVAASALAFFATIAIVYIEYKRQKK